MVSQQIKLLLPSLNCCNPFIIMHKAKRIAINGYGRIGRAVLRAIVERGLQHQLQVVAINDLGIAESVVYETRYDSVHGAFPATIEATERGMSVADTINIDLLQVSNAQALPWGDLDIDLVMECSGKMSEPPPTPWTLTPPSPTITTSDCCPTCSRLTWDPSTGAWWRWSAGRGSSPCQGPRL
jgi:hypothetical protein